MSWQHHNSSNTPLSTSYSEADMYHLHSQGSGFPNQYFLNPQILQASAPEFYPPNFNQHQDYASFNSLNNGQFAHPISQTSNLDVQYDMNRRPDSRSLNSYQNTHSYSRSNHRNQYRDGGRTYSGRPNQSEAQRFNHFSPNPSNANNRTDDFYQEGYQYSYDNSKSHNKKQVYKHHQKHQPRQSGNEDFYHNSFSASNDNVQSFRSRPKQGAAARKKNEKDVPMEKENEDQGTNHDFAKSAKKYGKGKFSEDRTGQGQWDKSGKSSNRDSFYEHNTSNRSRENFENPNRYENNFHKNKSSKSKGSLMSVVSNPKDCYINNKLHKKNIQAKGVSNGKVSNSEENQRGWFIYRYSAVNY